MMHTDIHAERGVLSAICQHHSRFFLDIGEILNEDCFSTQTHRAIWKCASSILEDGASSPITFLALFSKANELRLEEILSERSEREYVNVLINMPVPLEAANKLALKLAKLSLARKLDKSHQQARADLATITGLESVEQIITLSERAITDTVLSLHHSEEDIVHMGEFVEDYIVYLRENQGAALGISTGLPHYDRYLGGGMRGGSVNLIGARRGVGKSHFGRGVAWNIARDDIPCLILDTEMDKEDQTSRWLADLTSTSIREIESGNLPTNIGEVAKDVRKKPLYYKNISGKPFEETLSLMKRWVIRTVGLREDGKAKPCAIVFDYLKLMSPQEMIKQHLTEWQLMGFQMTSLHNFCVQWDIPCMAFVQLNREKDIAQSDRLEWLATSVAIFEKTDEVEYARDNQWNRKLTFIKDSRFGEPMGYGEHICYNLETRFSRLTEGPVKSATKTINTAQLD